MHFWIFFFYWIIHFIQQIFKLPFAVHWEQVTPPLRWQIVCSVGAVFDNTRLTLLSPHRSYSSLSFGVLAIAARVLLCSLLYGAGLCI